MVRGRGKVDSEAYWRKVLDYSLNGNLQSVLDEYAHVLREWLGVFDKTPGGLGKSLGDGLYDALTIRSADYAVDEIHVGGRNPLEITGRRLRARYAVRFGSERSDDATDRQRERQVRAAFNSPFWPFVLATTSVGQEGLDFHLYCHAVVHWNLPANPVDFEQREGRVHRYKGHAIRKNVATANRAAAFRNPNGDPWEAMFKSAARGRPRGAGDIIPFWIYPIDGGAQIERYVPLLPLSRDVEKLARLKRSLAVYRLAFGQPRQDDLVTYLASLPESEQAEFAKELRIDLAPR
jgi:hypothetical protein